MEGLQKLCEEFEAENEGVTIPTQVRWLADPQAISERRLNGEIAASLVAVVVNGEQDGKGLGQEGHQGGGSVVPSESVSERGP